MLSLQMVFIVTVALTVASGLAAAGLVVLGDTRKNGGQRTVAQTFAQIALLGAMAIVSLLALPRFATAGVDAGPFSICASPLIPRHGPTAG